MKTSSCHDSSIYLACSYQKTRWEKCPSYNICLIGRNERKKERKTSITSLAMLQYTNTWRPRVFSILPKIPEISVGSQQKRSILVSSDPYKWNLPFSFWQTGSLPYFFSLCLIWGLRKRNYKNGMNHSYIVGPGWSENVVPFCSGILTGIWPVSLAQWKKTWKTTGGAVTQQRSTTFHRYPFGRSLPV